MRVFWCGSTTIGVEASIIGRRCVTSGLEIINADFRTVIDTLAYDVIVTDAPYGVNIDYGIDGYNDTAEELRELANDLAPYLNRAAVFTGVQHNHLWKPPQWRLAWVQPSGSGSGPWGFSCWQPINVYGKDPQLQDGQGRRPDTFISKVHGSSDKEHPVAKPLSVMRWLIERTTRPGETILDPFAGSGTTAIAALEAGRNVICVERNPDFCDIIEQRTKSAPLALGFVD